MASMAMRRADRLRRNKLILGLHLCGLTDAKIGSLAGLSRTAVLQIVANGRKQLGLPSRAEEFARARQQREAKKLAKIKRNRKIIACRRMGFSYWIIAKSCGLHPSTVRYICLK